MLEPDLDLEADLGIDTVKQAEMLSEIRAAFGIPKQEGMKLSDYNTLAKVIGFARIDWRNPNLQAHRSPAPRRWCPTLVQSRSTPSPRTRGATRRDRNRHGPGGGAGQGARDRRPQDWLPGGDARARSRLEADLGIDTVKQAEMLSEIRAAFGIPKQEGMKLSDYNTLAKVIGFARDRLTQREPTDSQTVSKTEPTTSKSAKAGPLPLASIAAESEQLRFLAPVLVRRPDRDNCLPTCTRLDGLSIVVGTMAWRNRSAPGSRPAVRTWYASPTTAIPTASLQRSPAALATARSSETPAGIWLLSPLAPAVRPEVLIRQVGNERWIYVPACPFGWPRPWTESQADQPESFSSRPPAWAEPWAWPRAVSTRQPEPPRGLIKALAHEWKKRLCKAVDFPAEASPDTIAGRLA